MHDPRTVAWRIRIPLPWKTKGAYPMRAKVYIATIWHVDPEKDGSDDSCSIAKRLTKAQDSMLKLSGGDEARNPWFQRERAKEPQSPADAECLLRGALWVIARRLRLHRFSVFHKRISFARCSALAVELLHCGVDNVRSGLCLLPGYHTNEPEPDRYPADTLEWKRRDLAEGFFRMIGRILCRESARWWQHPRWHFWHWRLQVHAWQWAKRRWIERCDLCGTRFRGGTVFSDWDCVRKWCATCGAKSHKDREVASDAEGGTPMTMATESMPGGES